MVKRSRLPSLCRDRSMGRGSPNAGSRVGSRRQGLPCPTGVDSGARSEIGVAKDKLVSITWLVQKYDNLIGFGISSAPLWDSSRGQIVGLRTPIDFIILLREATRSIKYQSHFKDYVVSHCN